MTLKLPLPERKAETQTHAAEILNSAGTRFEKEIADYQPDLMLTIPTSGTMLASITDATHGIPMGSIDVSREFTGAFAESEDGNDVVLSAMESTDLESYYAWLDYNVNDHTPLGQRLEASIQNVMGLLNRAVSENLDRPLRVMIADDYILGGGTLGVSAPWIVLKAAERLGIVQPEQLKEVIRNMQNWFFDDEAYTFPRLDLGGIEINRFVMSKDEWIHPVIDSLFEDVKDEVQKFAEEIELTDPAGKDRLKKEYDRAMYAIIGNCMRGRMRIDGRWNDTITTEDDVLEIIGSFDAQIQKKFSLEELPTLKALFNDKILSYLLELHGNMPQILRELRGSKPQ